MNSKKAVAKIESRLGLASAADGLARYASSDNNYLGDLLKCSGKTGELTYGRQGTVLKPGTRFAVLLSEGKVGYIEWIDGKPAQQAWLPLLEAGPDELRALRASMGGTDAAEWDGELGLNGQPRDPKRESFMLPMVGTSDGKLFTLSSSAINACREVKRLAKNCAIHVRVAPPAFADHVPIVTLDVGKKSMGGQVGTVFFPIFDVEDWMSPGQVMHLLAKSGNASAFGASDTEALNADLGSEPDEGDADDEPRRVRERKTQTKRFK
jgi:hypothetical protein